MTTDATLRIFRTRTHSDGKFLGQVEVFHPHRSRDGTYTLGPRSRQDRHHVVARVSLSDIAEVARLLRTGRYCLRMRGELTGDVSMIQPDAITIAENGGGAGVRLRKVTP